MEPTVSVVRWGGGNEPGHGTGDRKSGERLQVKEEGAELATGWQRCWQELPATPD